LRLFQFPHRLFSLQLAMLHNKHIYIYLKILYGSKLYIYYADTVMNKKHCICTISQIYFGAELYMFRTGLQSIIRSLVLYTQQ